MNICFIGNYHKTIFFQAVADVLIQNDYNIFWIVNDIDQYKRLVSIYGDNNVLRISKENIAKPMEPIDDFKINEIIYGDRVFIKYQQLGRKLLNNIQRPVYDFIKNNGIRNIFGELTWGHEILIHRMCKRRTELNCRYLNPHTIRIPNGRFAFFSDEQQSQIVLRKQKSMSIEISDNTIEKPDYLEINNKLNRSKNSLLGLVMRTKKFLFNEYHNDPNDFTRFRKVDTIKLRFQETLKRLKYSLFMKTIGMDEIDKPFVYVTLHKQPEASIDVIGRYYEDQAANIINIWRNIPSNWSLVIKEHPNAIGDRNLKFYKELQSYDGIEFINHKVDSKKLITESKAVFTVSGTVAYEAALLNVPSFTLGPCFFNGYGGCVHTTMKNLRSSFNFEELMKQSEKCGGGKIKDLKEFVQLNSFEGYISDIITNPAIMKQNNVQNVARAIIEITL